MDFALQEAVIVSACRTPVGAFRGNMSKLKAIDLGAIAIKAAIDQAGINPDKIEEIFMGNVLQANNGQNAARQTALTAGLPDTIPAVTINKVCSSGLKAIALASQGLILDQQQCVLAGGMESMSNAPFYMERGEIPYGGGRFIDGILRDGLVDSHNNVHMGECAEKTAKEYGISREMQDNYAIESYKRAANAWKEGIFNSEVVSVSVPLRNSPPLIIREDEDFKKLNEDKVRKLQPAFIKDSTGTITAANASSLNDGAAACLLMTAKGAKNMGVRPLAKIVGFADAALSPVDFTMAPTKAMSKLLNQCKLNIADIDVWEINEAFSVTALANMKEMGLNHSKVNIHGGAVAVGHPIGMSGARLVVHLVHVLSPGQKGMIGVCNGGGGASAMIIEKL